MEQSTNIVQGSLYVRTEDIAELQQILNSIEKDMKLPTGQLLSEKADRFPTHFVEN